MSTDWRELLDRVLDGEELSKAEAHALARALDEAPNRRETQGWLVFEAELKSRLGPAGAADVALSRERLLAEAALREKSRRRHARLPARQPATWALAAPAAAILVVLLGGWLLLRGRGYPEPQASGDFRLERAAGPAAPSGAVRRGDRIRVGQGRARLALGGYCDLTLDPDAEVIVRGRAREEAVEIHKGRVASRIRPGRGEFTVLTPLGSVEVRGTEFVTTVEYSDPQQGGQAMGKLRKTAVVTVMVLSGVVAYNLADTAGLLRAGMSQAFAGGYRAGSDVAEGIEGFQGTLVGKIVAKAENKFLLKVEKVARLGENNKAKNPDSLIGKSVKIFLDKKSGRVDQQAEALAGLRPGDRVLVEAAHLEGDALYVVESLRKTEDSDGEREEKVARKEGGDREREEKAEARRPDGERGEKKERKERAEETERPKKDERKELAEGREGKVEKGGEDWDEEWVRQTQKEIDGWLEKRKRSEGEGEAERPKKDERRERAEEPERKAAKEGEDWDEEWVRQTQKEVDGWLEKRKRSEGEGEGERREEKREGRGEDAEGREKREREAPQAVTIKGRVKAAQGEQLQHGIAAVLVAVERAETDGGVVERERVYFITADDNGVGLADAANGRRAVVVGTLETKRRGKDEVRWVAVKRFEVLDAPAGEDAEALEKKRRLEREREAAGREKERKERGEDGERTERAERKEWGEEREAVAPRDDFGGFRGTLKGTIVLKGEKGFVLKVEEIEKVWGSNKAKKPESLVGRDVTVFLGEDEPPQGRLAKALADLKAGDQVIVGTVHREGSRLTVGDILRKAD